ncbi:MAG: hypothetical protein J7527_06230, partial [Chitinophagaceae bacterium]|nr:hypothetical protein [Chitinophagaceae bacterium]
ITHAECCSQKLTGDSTGNDPMDDLRCLDYNGLSADGQNRPRTDPQAAINFINSDCQLALVQGFCWSEHLGAVTGCQKNHNGKICSELINHSTTYHTH